VLAQGAVLGMINELDRARLEKLLGMLGSTFEGERANAALMIANMAARLKLTIAEMCTAQVVRASRRRKERAKLTVILDQLRQIADAEFMYISSWELEFAQDVSSKYDEDDELSEKQKKIVERIINKVDAAKQRHSARA
jgi:hypothetical protein